MQIFHQLNYPNLKLGLSPYSVRQDGCLALSVLEYYNWVFGKDEQPEDFINKLAYDENGVLQWPSLANVGLKLVSRIDGRNDVYMRNAIKDPVEGCIIAVKDNAHFMLALSYKQNGNYTVADTLTGKPNTTENYGNMISGARIITKI